MALIEGKRLYVRPFTKYLDELRVTLDMAFNGNRDVKHFGHLLNGGPGEALRQLVPPDVLKESGIFFTPHPLADEVALLLRENIQSGSIILDPACGVGDLLISCAKHLPLMSDFQATIEAWSSRLYGHELYPEFVEATKIRLMLLALSRGVKVSGDHMPCDIFGRITQGNALNTTIGITKEVCIILNPPYSLVSTPEKCGWSTGLVSQAAIFMEKCVSEASNGTIIAAILPDVLRAGSRYRKWRSFIESRTKIQAIQIVGRFDSRTDVDVFTGKFEVKEEDAKVAPGNWWREEVSQKGDEIVGNRTVGDLFDVRVGPVVPHRHVEAGDPHPYITARTVPRWEVVENIASSRRFLGTTFAPPFVVVRRTSGPADKVRSIATVISGTASFAVENHLLVLSPKSGGLKNCLKLLALLKNEATSKWLNRRIRCRHLTVGALSDLPWIDDDTRPF